ncbi:MAG: precorrin-6y C5,15-methyltransferase (decarboxylating) subunit CbiE, partial [Lachnospiraceae bacterium]|nr:precorrin-6y C5,15-methyltransferase (decarboxylating) subunit CbiE [Lachnospiraceae bacterium]
RVKRGEAGDEPEGVMKYPDVKAIASAMNESTGRMLLTTGSKELECFFGSLSGSRRADVFVRVLPTVESIELCEKQGVASDHIIAMQGPFTAEMNEAVIRQYDIKHLITKNSGSAGGYREKLDAARHTGTGIHVVERPGESDGVTVEEAYRMVAGKRAVFSIIGIGMGNPKTMTLEAKEAIEGAEAVFGAVRLIKDLKSREKYEMYMASDIIPVLEREDISNAAVIFSGDIGFYSGAMGMYKALREWKESATIRMIPGVSSFSYLASRLGETYDDAYTFSIHGKNIEENMGELTALYEKSGKVYVLLSDASDIKAIAEKLIEKGLKGNVYLGSDLSYESEIIREMTFEKAAGYEGKGLATALIKDE